MSFDLDESESEAINGVKILTPSVHVEPRGQIWTSFESKSYADIAPLHFNHDKFSVSKKNVLRGIHGDTKTWKLIMCPYGDITVVIVDFRPDSPTYRHYEMLRLDFDSKKQVLIPPEVGNSFYVHSDSAVYHYKLAYEGDYADAGEQFTVMWNDPELAIPWPCENPILSARDERLT